jgi:hypothetical protein
VEGAIQKGKGAPIILIPLIIDWLLPILSKAVQDANDFADFLHALSSVSSFGLVMSFKIP